MSEWKLTEEDNPYPSLLSGLPTDDVCYSEYDLAASFESGGKAQVKKLAEHYEGQCTEHWRHTSWYVPRRRCDSCMMELYRQVGL